MNEFPLHYYVFENDISSLRTILAQTPKSEIERKDLRDKTPLELAVFLNHFDCGKLLVEHGADCCHVTKLGWNLVQESVSTGNSDLIKLIIQNRDFQRTSARTNGIPELLNKLKQTPDFYVEMKWEFTSWIPLISKACPSDVYKIYKSGGNVRIDTTLIGFNGTTWERGNRSYIFQATNDGSATLIEIDHIKRTYHMDKMNALDNDETSDVYEPDESVIQTKLTSPNIVTYLDIDKIEFERNRSGIWGWRTEKKENINGHECKVYTANNLQLVTKTRMEHLNSERALEFLREMEENENESQQRQAGNLPGFLSNIFQGSQQTIKIEKSSKKLTSQEYFNKHFNVDYYLNGSIRSINENRRVQTFNATLSLSESYPLLLHEQVSPIVDLMALNNSHFKKLKEFITLQLPSGFPVKIEIPLYRVITAKVTFGNIHASDNNVEYVTPIRNFLPTNSLNVKKSESKSSLISNSSNEANLQETPTCVVDEEAFKIPSSYRCTNYLMPDTLGASLSTSQERRPHPTHYGQAVDEDDILLQLAIQQSLASSEQSDDAQLTALEVLGGRENSNLPNDLRLFNERRVVYDQTNDDIMLQRALAVSLGDTTLTANQEQGALGYEDEAMKRILEISKREEEERRQRELDEDEELRKILELSLVEK
ncbi:unnamed protein product [Brachionus calyciflorus]|uniref:Ankyrin repeat domain-containing protein n=1 Tax=Brachionus calyciflorus TaxID=104777 RepID=A0A813LY94_9BILA|nr:unnamed protein product [Brachionus calyciflorus]